MVASVVLGYATVALSGNELGLIGSIIGGVSTIIAAVMSISAASRRQKRELRYQRKGSGMTGFLLALLLISIAAGLYFANRPKHEETAQASEEATGVPTTQPTIAPTAAPTVASTSTPTIVPTTPASAAPITPEEATAFVASYLEAANDEGTVDQAWAMFSDAHIGELASKHFDVESLRRFWQEVDTLDITGAPEVSAESTPARAVILYHLTYHMLVDANKDGALDCTVERDTFTLIRVNGSLRIDAYLPKAVDC